MPAPRDERQDEPVLEVEAPVRLQADEHLREQCAWGALDGARRVARDAADLRRLLEGGDAEKLVGRARDVPARDAWSRLALRSAQLEPRASAAELCTPGAARSGERSCAAQEAAAGRKQRAEPGVVRPEVEARPMQ